MTLPSDTFKYVPVGLLPSPGNCVICGTNQRGCIDMGFNAEFYGAVLICEECIKEIAHVDEIGLMLRSEAGGLLEENLRLTARDMEMENVRRELRDDLVAVADRLDRRVADSLPSPVVDTKKPAESTKVLF